MRWLRWSLTVFVTIVVGAPPCAQAQSTNSVVSRLDHIMISTPNHDRLVALFRDTLQLPLVWPSPGSQFAYSTGLALGDVNLEFIPRPQAPITRFTNLAFQPTNFEHAEVRLRELGLAPLAPGVETTDTGARRWTVIGFRLGHPGPGFFLIQYHQFDMNARRDRFIDSLRARHGGPLGLVGVKEIRLAYDSLQLPPARESWRRLFGLKTLPPTDEFTPPAGPRVRLLRDDNAPSNSMLLEVQSLRLAERAARALQLLLLASPDSLVLNPDRVGGLRLTLVAR